MSTTLTFTDQKLLESAVVDAEGTVQYTTTTTSGFRGRKITTIMAASGPVGVMNWRQKTFTINGVHREWEYLKSRSGGIFSSEREWKWDHRHYKLKYHDSQKELLATPNFANAAGTVRFTTYRSHLFHDNKRAAIYFPSQMEDETEKMFLLMAILQTEIRRQDRARNARNNAAASSAMASSAVATSGPC
ncbi:hypothetical protein MVEN_01160800 [Mycena venus]|uniref:Uncharacterized protein n=1 Tax=Mycena venus TaxID=2733690 RepID=A0A8H7CXV7_9AGAR|nr:hypothetical protein MVEN_01160800 [Mycena venus]